MRLTDFFNLSIREVEEYLESHKIYDNPSIDQQRRDLDKRLELTGRNDCVLGYCGKIHVLKKSNLYGVFSIGLREVEQKYVVFIHLYYKKVYIIKLIISPQTRKIERTEVSGVSERNKTKTLAEIIEKRFRKG